MALPTLIVVISDAVISICNSSKRDVGNSVMKFRIVNCFAGDTKKRNFYFKRLIVIITNSAVRIILF